jgi:hypothetical protein
MTTWIRVAMVVSVTVCSAMVVSAQVSKPVLYRPTAIVGGAADDNMTPYRQLAADTLQAFKAHDLPTTKKKARELEAAWDTREKALQKRSPELWGQIDKAMDAFIKPVQTKSADPAQIQTAYDKFIEKLQLAVTSR